MPDERPFDATENYLCDASEPAMGKWHTTSLVTALKGILGRKPEFERGGGRGTRLAAFRSAADELTRRGLDASSLVRYGMWDIIASSIWNALVQSATVGIERPGGMSRAAADAWWVALDLPERPAFHDTPAPEEAGDLMLDTILPSIHRLVRWICTASVSDLVKLAPPPEIIPEDPACAPTGGLFDQYDWAVDHFSSTFYSEWSTTSLHYAYRWLSGHEVPPCTPELMSDRHVDSTQLNAEIARRAATRQPSGPAQPGIDALLAGEMVTYAISLLNEKRFREAAAIFEFAAAQKPYDGQFRNNLGFCLIPEDPLAALGHLQAASEMNFPQRVLNVYNQMCCYVALRRPREALGLAEESWNDILSAHPSGATIWKHDGSLSEWAICHTDDDRGSTVDLAIALAHMEGWSVEEQTWRERRVELGH